MIQAWLLANPQDEAEVIGEIDFDGERIVSKLLDERWRQQFDVIFRDDHPLADLKASDPKVWLSMLPEVYSGSRFWCQVKQATETHQGHWVTIKGRPVFIESGGENPVDAAGHGGTATTATYGKHANARKIAGGPDLPAGFSKTVGTWNADGTFTMHDDPEAAKWREKFSSGDVNDAPVPFAVHQPGESDWWMNQKSLAAGSDIAPTIENVPVASLIATQYAVNTRYVQPQIAAYAKNADKTIDVIESGGKRYIFDGHHRAVAAAVLGKTEIRAKVWTKRS